MDLTPGERAVLRQVADLFASTSSREHPLTTLTTQWPPIHYEAYQTALAALVGRNLLQTPGDSQTVRLTDAGMRAMGLDSSTQTIDLKVLAKSKSHSPHKAAPKKPSSRKKTTYHGPAEKTPMSAMGRITLVAIVASAGWLVWRFL